MQHPHRLPKARGRAAGLYGVGGVGVGGDCGRQGCRPGDGGQAAGCPRPRQEPLVGVLGHGMVWGGWAGPTGQTRRAQISPICPAATVGTSKGLPSVACTRGSGRCQP